MLAEGQGLDEKRLDSSVTTGLVRNEDRSSRPLGLSPEIMAGDSDFSKKQGEFVLHFTI
jgi:hypothetical protein